MQNSAIFAIEGGRVVNKQDYFFAQYVKKLDLPNDKFCSGTLIDPKHIMTAAHCFLPIPKPTNFYPTKEMVAWIHPEALKIYSNSSKGVYADNFRHFDIAIIETNEFEKYSNYPLLPNSAMASNTMSDETVFLVGHGNTKSIWNAAEDKFDYSNPDYRIGEFKKNDFKFMIDDKKIDDKFSDNDDDNIKIAEFGNNEPAIFFSGSREYSLTPNWLGMNTEISQLKQPCALPGDSGGPILTVGQDKSHIDLLGISSLLQRQIATSNLSFKLVAHHKHNALTMNIPLTEKFKYEDWIDATVSNKKIGVNTMAEKYLLTQGYSMSDFKISRIYQVFVTTWFVNLKSDEMQKFLKDKLCKLQSTAIYQPQLCQ